MLVSNLFRSVHKGYVLMLRFSSDSQAKKVKVGKIIKKLNKENKSLFGELLETRSEKRKRESRKEPVLSLSNSVENGASSEVLWYSRTMPSSCVVKLTKNTNSKHDIPDKGSVLKKTCGVRKISSNADHCLKDKKNMDEHEVLGPAEHTVNFALPVVSGKEVPVENVAQRTLRKQHALVLPDIIIRNIPTFPLLNESKRVDCVTLDKMLNNENINNKDYLSYPSVSKILNQTMSESSLAALKRWRKKLISELGEEGFLTYYRGLLDRGSQFHSVVHGYLSGTPESDLTLDPQIQGCWHSLRDVVRDVAEARVLESHVVHSELRYRGVIDCVAQYKGKDVLIEWKKSDKHKPEIEKTYDAPLQLCAYIGAMNYDVKYNFQVQGGLVVVAYSDGSPANIFKMTMTDCNKYWKLWLNRLQQYWQQRQEQQRNKDKAEESL